MMDDQEATRIVDELPDDLNVAPDLTGERLFCEACGKTGFKNQRGLNLHTAKMHGFGADKKPTVRKSKKSDELRSDLEVTFAMLAMGVAAWNPDDGAVVMEGSTRLAKALVHASEKNPKLRKVLENMTTGFAYSELVAACMAIAIPIMANHGMLPERFATAAVLFAGVPDDASGITPPDNGTMFG